MSKKILAVLLAMLIVVFTFASCKKEKEPDSYYVDDEGNIYTPIVTLEVENNILPLDPSGMMTRTQLTRLNKTRKTKKLNLYLMK